MQTLRVLAYKRDESGSHTPVGFSGGIHGFVTHYPPAVGDTVVVPDDHALYKVADRSWHYPRAGSADYRDAIVTLTLTLVEY